MLSVASENETRSATMPGGISRNIFTCCNISYGRVKPGDSYRLNDDRYLRSQATKTIHGCYAIMNIRSSLCAMGIRVVMQSTHQGDRAFDAATINVTTNGSYNPTPACFRARVIQSPQSAAPWWSIRVRWTDRAVSFRLTSGRAVELH